MSEVCRAELNVHGMPHEDKTEIIFANEISIHGRAVSIANKSGIIERLVTISQNGDVCTNDEHGYVHEASLSSLGVSSLQAGTVAGTVYVAAFTAKDIDKKQDAAALLVSAASSMIIDALNATALNALTPMVFVKLPVQLNPVTLERVARTFNLDAFYDGKGCVAFSHTESVNIEATIAFSLGEMTTADHCDLSIVALPILLEVNENNVFSEDEERIEPVVPEAEKPRNNDKTALRMFQACGAFIICCIVVSLWVFTFEDANPSFRNDTKFD
tara:strand:- start:111 stop:926 length:816 start_codon:yes stop_codon:yes gene_type:complete